MEEQIFEFEINYSQQKVLDRNTPKIVASKIYCKI